MAMNVELKTRLQSEEFGLNDEQIGKLEAAGLKEATDFALLSGTQIAEIASVGIITAMRIGQAFAPVPAPVAVNPVVTDESNGDGGKPPSKDEVASFANTLGMDPNLLMVMLMSGGMGGGVGSIAGAIPYGPLLQSYVPRRVDIAYQVMAAVEERLGTNVIIINSDGSINRELTAKYIESLEAGYDPSPDGVYTDDGGKLYEIVRVGVDAQSVADADPLNPTKALQQNQMGTGRVMWSGVNLDVRQVVFLAITETKELNAGNDAHLQWLRDNIKPGVSRLALNGQVPKAASLYNEKFRTGSLPTLRVMLGRGPRRPEIAPRRRYTTPRDLSGIGKNNPFGGDDDRL